MNELMQQSMFFGAVISIATYLLGPLLPLNPQFALSLLRAMAPEAEFAYLPYEEDAYRLRVEELSRPEANQKHH